MSRHALAMLPPLGTTVAPPSIRREQVSRRALSPETEPGVFLVHVGGGLVPCVLTQTQCPPHRDF